MFLDVLRLLLKHETREIDLPAMGEHHAEFSRFDDREKRVILGSGTETGGNRRKLSSFFETAEGEQVTFIMTQAAPQTLQTTENVLHKSPAARAYPPTRLQAQESCMVAAASPRKKADPAAITEGEK